MDVRVDAVNQRIYSVFPALQMIWKNNVALLICVLALAQL